MKKSFEFEYEKWIAGTAFLSRKEKGAYMDLLCMQAEKGHMSLEEIKNILNGDFDDCWPKLKSKFTEENGLYYNRKLESVKKTKKKPEVIIDRTKIEQRIKENKLKFYEDCKPYLEKYPKEMLRAFYNYWTELNKSNTKMKYELQQTFEIGKRLATWAGRDNSIIKASPENITYKELVRRFNAGETDIWERYEHIKDNGKDMYKLK